MRIFSGLHGRKLLLKRRDLLLKLPPLCKLLLLLRIGSLPRSHLGLDLVCLAHLLLEVADLLVQSLLGVIASCRSGLGHLDSSDSRGSLGHPLVVVLAASLSLLGLLLLIPLLSLGLGRLLLAREVVGVHARHEARDLVFPELAALGLELGDFILGHVALLHLPLRPPGAIRALRSRDDVVFVQVDVAHLLRVLSARRCAAQRGACVESWRLLPS
mmetsp:Transcript_2610/g.6407  ORF Transcript_2610/g.6407 Transcript_2610/m.6407 type:complete len:215 (-) Transcript_2610:57-701(-)